MKDEAKAEKVIPFPATDAVPPKGEMTMKQMRAKARQALRALEKNNSVAAYKALKQIVPE